MRDVVNGMSGGVLRFVGALFNAIHRRVYCMLAFHPMKEIAASGTILSFCDFHTGILINT